MRINANTKVVGVFGYPIAHSLSPVFHNAAFAELGLDFVYLPFPVRPKDLKSAVEAIKSLNLVGVNVTIPHKEKIISYLDEIPPQARMMGAVNTVHQEKGRLIGYNTDGEGFIQSLTREGKFDPRGKDVLLLGAGGAAFSISFALIKAGVRKLTMVNRTLEKGKTLLNHLRKVFPHRCELALLDFERRNSPGAMNGIDLLVNATSVGMDPHDPLLVNLDLFHENIFIYDVIYNRKTKLLKVAEEKGLPCLGGMEMLIYQGALSFQIWTHQKAPLKVMREALKKGENAPLSNGW